MTKDEVNKRLKENFGLFQDGLPKYRVVWSTDEVEKRVGEHELWYGEIFVKKFQGIKEYKKYDYCPEKWILEIRAYTFNAELVEPVSYEPLFVMQDKFGNYLPLNYDACVAAINSVESRPVRQPRSWKQDVYEEEALLQKDKKVLLNKLNERGRDNMDWKWADKEAVFIPNKEADSPLVKVNGSSPEDNDV